MAFMAAASPARADWSIQPESAGSPGCTLESASITMHDGYQDTRVRLNIDEQRLLVITESNIDSGFGDLDLQVDGRASIPADTVADEQSVLFTTNIATIVEQFRKGNSARINLRFWPTYPATQRYSAKFSLNGFTRAWNEYLECRNRNPGTTVR
jgi:hypothetical protein